MADDRVKLPEEDTSKYPDPNVRETFRRERLSKENAPEKPRENP